jgi:putative endonuclease
MTAQSSQIQSSDNYDTLGSELLNPDIGAQELGRLGEEFVSSWLKSRGWDIIDRNWSSRYGELDIVAFDDERTLVFVEVKTRRSNRHGTGQEAVTYRKRMNLRSAASQWLLDPEHRCRRNGLRFDVVALDASGASLRIRHIMKAF